MKKMKALVKAKAEPGLWLEEVSVPEPAHDEVSRQVIWCRVKGILSETSTFDWNKVVFNGLTLKGIYGREMYETWYKMSSMIQSGLDIEPLITHRFHYTDFEEGFKTMASGMSGKVILNWE